MKKIHQISVLAFLIFCFSHISAQRYDFLTDAGRLQMLVHPEGKVDVVFDSDTYNEIDDQFALVYALLSKEKMNVKAIYAAPFLNARSTSAADGMQKSYEEILRILELMKIPSEGLAYKGSAEF